MLHPDACVRRLSGGRRAAPRGVQSEAAHAFRFRATPPPPSLLFRLSSPARAAGPAERAAPASGARAGRRPGRSRPGRTGRSPPGRGGWGLGRPSREEEKRRREERQMRAPARQIGRAGGERVCARVGGCACVEAPHARALHGRRGKEEVRRQWPAFTLATAPLGSLSFAPRSTLDDPLSQCRPPSHGTPTAWTSSPCGGRR